MFLVRVLGPGYYHFETLACCFGIVFITFELKLGAGRPGGMRGAFKFAGPLARGVLDLQNLDIYLAYVTLVTYF